MSDPHRYTDEDFKQWTREQKCIVCLSPPPNDPHHMITRGASGSDRTCVPLCRTCHTKLGSMGLTDFEEAKKINLWKQAHRHLRRYIKATERHA